MASFFVFPDGYPLLAAKRKTGGGKNEIPGGKKSSGATSKKTKCRLMIVRLNWIHI